MGWRWAEGAGTGAEPLPLPNCFFNPPASWVPVQHLSASLAFRRVGRAARRRVRSEFPCEMCSTLVPSPAASCHSVLGDRFKPVPSKAQGKVTAQWFREGQS